ncbi:MAG TPA: hypothetical protein PLK77_06560 [Pyrinomonadaceae bacterium]|nr:hypothetical protein [Pyrinomonadaceae bacterium]
MEILNSGSFIPLDNRERTEQLIFTARTLAEEVSRNDGFQSSSQSNQQIGLELWNGAQYLTRSHEEVTVRNIFLSKFLERLREIEREPSKLASVTNSISMRSEEKFSTAETAVSPVPPIEVESNELGAQQDQFLGVVDSEDQTEERPSYANECIPECEDEIASILSSAATRSVVDSVGVQGGPQSSFRPVEERAEIGDSATQTDTELKADGGETDVDSLVEEEKLIQPSEASSGTQGEVEPIFGKQSVKPVILSEQEPYNFDSCTVTAVIQLLPEADGVRDCVLSVRSHSFAPQILFSNITGDNSRPNLSAQLSDALDQYRNALPGLAAEKLKKEKASTKKRASKPADKNTIAGEVTKATSIDSTPTPGPAGQEQPKDQRNLFAS